MSRVKKLRVGAALVGVTAMALLSSVTPAFAEAVTAKLDKAGDVRGPTVKMSGKNVETILFGLKVDGDNASLKAYCVDIDQDIDESGPGYVEADWNKHPKPDTNFKKNSDKINWVLHHGYPTVDEKALAKAVDIKGELTPAEAIAGTQSAVWHFSDGRKLEGVAAPKQDESDVFAVYNYLTGSKNVGISTEPKPVLTLEPNKLTGKPDSLIGPYVVTTTANGVTVTAKLPDGVIFSDKAGKELDKAAVAAKIQEQDKYEFYVKVPAGVPAGKVDFTVAGQTAFSLGRLFISKDAAKPSQSIILAKTEKVKLEAKGVAEWGVAPATTPTTPAPQPKNASNELANTGASILTPILIGVVLVGAGVGALVFQRRRRA